MSTPPKGLEARRGGRPLPRLVFYQSARIMSSPESAMTEIPIDSARRALHYFLSAAFAFSFLGAGLLDPGLTLAALSPAVLC